MAVFIWLMPLVILLHKITVRDAALSAFNITFTMLNFRMLIPCVCGVKERARELLCGVCVFFARRCHCCGSSTMHTRQRLQLFLAKAPPPPSQAQSGGRRNIPPAPVSRYSFAACVECMCVCAGACEWRKSPLGVRWDLPIRAYVYY